MREPSVSLEMCPSEGTKCVLGDVSQRENQVCPWRCVTAREPSVSLEMCHSEGTKCVPGDVSQ